MPEGKWASARHERNRTRAISASILLGLNVVLSAVLAYYIGIAGPGVVDGFVRGDVADSALLDWFQLLDTLSLIYVVLFVVTAIAFLAWQHRAVSNAPHVGVGTPRWSPNQSVVWWFVPIAWFVMPYVVLRDLARRLTASRATGLLVLIWWVAFLASNLALRFADLLPLESPGDLQTLLMLSAFAEVPSAIAAITAIWLVMTLERASSTRPVVAVSSPLRDSIQPTADPSIVDRRNALIEQLIGDDASNRDLPALQRVSLALGELRAMHGQGTIDAAEFESKKATLLAQL